MSAPLQTFTTQQHHVLRIYEIFDRHSRVVIGRVEVQRREDIESAAPWAIEYMKEGTEATDSRTGVRFIGERITRQQIRQSNNRHLHMKGMTR